jgi:hypothetical protein
MNDIEMMYAVRVIPGGRPLLYREMGGKKFTRKNAAVDHLNTLRKKGVRCELYEAEVHWNVIDADTPTDMDPLF